MDAPARQPFLKTFSEDQAKKIGPPPPGSDEFVRSLANDENVSNVPSLAQDVADELKATRFELQVALAVAHYAIDRYANGSMIVPKPVIDDAIQHDIFRAPKRDGYVVWIDEWRPEVAPADIPVSDAEGMVRRFDEEPSGDVEVDRG